MNDSNFKNETLFLRLSLPPRNGDISYAIFVAILLILTHAIEWLSDKSIAL